MDIDAIRRTTNQLRAEADASVLSRIELLASSYTELAQLVVASPEVLDPLRQEALVSTLQSLERLAESLRTTIEANIAMHEATVRAELFHSLHGDGDDATG